MAHGGALGGDARIGNQNPEEMEQTTVDELKEAYGWWLQNCMVDETQKGPTGESRRVRKSKTCGVLNKKFGPEVDEQTAVDNLKNDLGLWLLNCILDETQKGPSGEPQSLRKSAT